MQLVCTTCGLFVFIFIVTKSTCFHVIHFKSFRITVWSSTNEWVEIPLSSVTVKRPNYPYNCFTLDLSQNEEIRKKHLKQIFFYVLTLNGSSVELLLEEKRLGCSREIKDNKFYFSGPKIELEKLGKNCFKKLFEQAGFAVPHSSSTMGWVGVGS